VTLASKYTINQMMFKRTTPTSPMWIKLEKYLRSPLASTWNKMSTEYSAVKKIEEFRTKDM